MIEVALQGRLCKDAVLDHLRGGELARLVFSMVVLGQREDADKPRWVQCTVFGEQAEAMAPRLLKGVSCYVEGRLSVSPFLGRSGEPRTSLDVVATTCQPLGQIGRRRPQERRERPPQQTPAQHQPRAPQRDQDQPKPGFVHAWSRPLEATPFADPLDDTEAAVADLTGRGR